MTTDPMEVRSLTTVDSTLPAFALPRSGVINGPMPVAMTTAFANSCPSFFKKVIVFSSIQFRAFNVLCQRLKVPVGAYPKLPDRNFNPFPTHSHLVAVGLDCRLEAVVAVFQLL